MWGAIVRWWRGMRSIVDALICRRSAAMVFVFSMPLFTVQESDNILAR